MAGVDQLEIPAKVGEILNRWPAVGGLAVGVAPGGPVEFCRARAGGFRRGHAGQGRACRPAEGRWRRWR